MSDANNERPVWKGRVTFILAAVGSAIGLGNVWRFPYIAYASGGGAFLIPYIVALFLTGIPLLILELGMGQMTRSGAITAWRRQSRVWEWIGWYALFSAFMIILYYAVIMAWSFVFMWYSVKALFTAGGLPWAGNEHLFFKETVLHRTIGPGKFGGLVWPIVGGLLVTWLAIWFSIRRGVHSVGKIVWVTVLLPVVILLVLMVRGMTLPGAGEGLKHYLTPDFSKLKEFNVWRNAFGQIFFSLSVGFGIMIAYASHQRKDAEITNTGIMTALLNCGYSFLAGFAVFAVLGFLAFQQGVSVPEVVKGGPGLAFEVFPTILALLPGGPVTQAIFAVLFFAMLFFLGIDSAFSIVEGVAVGVHDRLQGKIMRKTVTLILCIVGFLGGLLYCLQSGLYWLDIVDHWMNNMGLLFVGFLQVVVIGWVVGPDRLKAFVSRVSELPIGRIWEHIIAWDMPRLLGAMVVIAFVADVSQPYGDYPWWMLNVFGWGTVIFGIALSIGLSFLDYRDTPQDEIAARDIERVQHHHVIDLRKIFTWPKDIILLAGYGLFVLVSWLVLKGVMGDSFTIGGFIMYLVFSTLVYGGIALSLMITFRRDAGFKRVGSVTMHMAVNKDDAAKLAGREVEVVSESIRLARESVQLAIELANDTSPAKEPGADREDVIGETLRRARENLRNAMKSGIKPAEENGENQAETQR